MIGRKRSNVLAQTMMLATDVSSSMVMKMTPLAEPGRWRMVTRPETATRAPDLRVRLRRIDAKQRQIIVLVANAAERLRRPQGLPPRQAERAEGIGVGEPLDD